ncbi:hypothetical protein [Pontibacter sp. HSC-36F09]|uniref:hypothetical protein n=1 Tax=Pontibacter sp. HSC-36F09 TaxID=2910966 RepID=UPI00209EAC21|nr:hypothetical protein [Pontibacter sp. HSC-36F09]MCP2045481.1 hypothetical protein [Pontibacter sp. HSC-36F09]
MHPILRNILAVVAGIVVGSVVNMALISVSGTVIPPPNGADVTTTEGLQATMHLFDPKHYLFPFLAHALGTLTGAFLAATIAATHKFKFAMSVGVFFLAGGIASVFMLPSPVWFTALDLTVAYLPMAYIAYLLSQRLILARA